jgi:ElaB/YqjD/DUF883 family membrane-anchored ribosome-binding protein
MQQELPMADPKNEPGKTSSTDKRTTGSESGTGGKISAGTSVGNVGETPMPQAHDPSKPAQSSTLASHTSKPLGGQGTDRDQSAGQSGQSGQDRSGREQTSQAQSGSTGGRAQQGGAQAGEQVRETADQVRQRAGEAYEDAAEWAQDTYERASHWASDTFENQSGRMSDMRDRSTRAFGHARGSVQQYVAENPMVVGLVGLAAGLVLGALLPRTRRENEAFGEWADEVRNQGLRYAREATNMGREYVEEAFSGDDPRFSKHESEYRSDQPGSNRH